MKKFLAAILVAMSLMNILGFAATDATGIAVLKRKVDANGVTNGITVKVQLGTNLEADDEVSLTLEKKLVGTADETPEETAKRIYAVQEKIITAEDLSATDKTWTVTVTIPELRYDLEGSGEYLLRISTSKADTDSEEFFYADKNGVDAFLADLKNADNPEVAEEIRNEALVSVMTADSTKGVMFSIGMNADDFLQAASTVQLDTMNVLHGDGIQSLTIATLPDALSKAFGLATYNAGDKVNGVKVLVPTYGGAEVEETMVTQALAAMSPSYSDTTSFVNGFTLAYGFATLNGANINNIAEQLNDFKTATASIDDTTGKCATLIAQINALKTARLAYIYIIEQVAQTPITSSAQMKTVLQNAYDAAINPAPGNGGGNGGGTTGNVANAGKKPGSSVSTATGFGNTEGKIDQTGVFTDLSKNHWSATAVQWLKNKGVVNGTDTGAFEPERAVTREEFTKMLVAICGFKLSDTTATFADLESGAWYVPYIMIAKEQGIVNGIDEVTFGVGQRITRQDMAVMTSNAIKAKNVSLKAVNIYSEFADDSEIADYAADAIKALFEAGIINGKGENNFDPSGSATRAEAAKIIYEAFKGGF